jgi:hypothetical protein
MLFSINMWIGGPGSFRSRGFILLGTLAMVQLSGVVSAGYVALVAPRADPEKSD